MTPVAGPARFQRIALGLALAAALAVLSLALIGGLFAGLMVTIGGLSQAHAGQARWALPLITGLVIVLGLLLRWRLRKRRGAKDCSRTGTST